MNGLLQAHPPTISYGVIGCSMYENENSILCCVAKDDWGFGDVGVIDDSIVFVQRKASIWLLGRSSDLMSATVKTRFTKCPDTKSPVNMSAER